jgi:lysozyme family protein
VGDIASRPIANKLLYIGIICGVGIAAKMAQQGVAALGVPVAIDEKVGDATVAAINRVDADSLMAELVSLSMDYYIKVAAAEQASPD